MSAATERNLLLCLESLEPDLRIAASAQRAGSGWGSTTGSPSSCGTGRRAAARRARREGERAATVGASGGRRPAAEPAPDDAPERTPAAPGRGDAPSRRGRTDLDALLALRDAVEEIRLALKNPRPARSDPETVRRAPVHPREARGDRGGAAVLDLSAAARRIEDAAERLSELAAAPREGRPPLRGRSKISHAASKRSPSASRAGMSSVPSATLLEALHARLEERERAGSGLLDRVERLAAKLERMAQDYGSTLARSTERLSRPRALRCRTTRLPWKAWPSAALDARLREAASRDEERLKPIEAMLRAVVERLGQAGRTGRRGRDARRPGAPGRPAGPAAGGPRGRGPGARRAAAGHGRSPRADRPPSATEALGAVERAARGGGPRRARLAFRPRALPRSARPGRSRRPEIARRCGR